MTFAKSIRPALSPISATLIGLTQFDVKVPKNWVLGGLRPPNTQFFGLFKL